ncbi:MAG TPA: AbrB/MazE/SpoVT family DNA-binding domain-containing protein [Actinobacteria bacterium]|nr:AbrB/MazE/SpoVT family DNA-binding domain-containing protein [Actinomycetota bacterium]
MKTTITQKGQVVIPAPIRKKRNIKVGQKFTVAEKGEKIILTPIKTLTPKKARGWLKTKQPAKMLLEKAREVDMQHERKLEQKRKTQ